MSAAPSVIAAEEGCYEASRAAALSGVPLSTVYHWARTDLVVPSISPTREMLWSWADLMTLRLVAWLRRPKQPEASSLVPASPMAQVRAVLEVMADRGVDPWADEGTPSVLVDRRGRILVQDDTRFIDLQGQATLELPETFLDLLRPFSWDARSEAPDLVRPRPSLRIVPAKVTGEPHVIDTRITSRTLAALVRRGVPRPTITEWYDVSGSAVADAADLEDQLAPPRAIA